MISPVKEGTDNLIHDFFVLGTEVQELKGTGLLPSDCGHKQIPQISERIINGWETSYGEWPWMVELRNTSSDEHLCGGALFSNQYILTAAHCFW